MKLYPQELKDRLIVRMLAPHNESVPALARETQIPKDTLYGWRKIALGQVTPGPAEAPSPVTLSSDDKFAIVLETARLNAHELGEYCAHPRPLHPAGAGLARTLHRRQCQRTQPGRTGADP